MNKNLGVDLFLWLFTCIVIGVMLEVSILGTGILAIAWCIGSLLLLDMARSKAGELLFLSQEGGGKYGRRKKSPLYSSPQEHSSVSYTGGDSSSSSSGSKAKEEQSE